MIRSPESSVEPTHSVEGRFDTILERMFLKDQYIREGQLDKASQIRILVYFQGGGQAVGEEVGFVEKLYKLGWFHNGVVDVVIGGSAGALIAAYGVTGDKGGIHHLERNCERGLANFQTLRQYRRPIDLLTVGKELEENPPDNNELQNVRSKVLVLTRTDEGRVAHDIRFLPSDRLRKVLHASCLIPGAGNVPYVIIDGVKHTDGDIGGIPHDIIDTEEPTDVLVIGSGSIKKSPRDQKIQQVMYQASRLVQDKIIKIALATAQLGDESMKEMWMRHWHEDPEYPVNYAYIGPSEGQLGLATRDWGLIQERIASSQASAEFYFGRRHTVSSSEELSA